METTNIKVQEQSPILRKPRKVKSIKSCKQFREKNAPWLTGGSWEPHQNMRYIRCVQEYQEILESELLRRSSKIFEKMAKKLKTRSPAQCRSHHQKLCLKYKNLKGILTYFKQQVIEEANFRNYVQVEPLKLSFSQQKSISKCQEQKGSMSKKLMSELQEQLQDQEDLFPTKSDQCSYSCNQDIFNQSRIIVQNKQVWKKIDQQMDFIGQFLAL